MSHPVRLFLSLIFPVALVVLGGCANPWQKSFEPTPPFKATKFTPTESAEIRYVEPERFEAYSADYARRRAASDVAIEDMPWADQAAEMDKLMQALRLPLRVPQAVDIGTSEFADLGRGAVDEKQLRAFAQKIGADYAVVVREFMGTVRTTEQQPVDTTVNTNDVFRDRHGRLVSTSSYGTSTTWVPVSVDKDQWHFVAYYIRKVRPGDPVP